MELNREQIIKALECCASEEYICTQCPIDEKIKDDCECGKVVARNVLSLVKELTEENERLRAEANKLDALCDELGVDIDVKLKHIYELEDKLKAEKADVMYFKDQIRADTVKKMQERLNKECLIDRGYEVLLEGTIDQIAKEMLEGTVNAEHCIVCGGVIPEGRQVCPNCEKRSDKG